MTIPSDACCTSTAADSPASQNEQQETSQGFSAPTTPAAACGAQAEGEAAQESNPIVLGTSLFFARVPPTVTYEAIMDLFQEFGKVITLNLFRPWATAKTSKGCGIVVFDSMTSAVAAMEALHNKHHWTGGETTMVVEWADPSRHRKESANAKGVFEAKHKTSANANSRGRYRAHVRRSMAVGMHPAYAAADIFSHQFGRALPSLLAASSMSKRHAALGNRGVASMLPQFEDINFSAAAAAAAAGPAWGFAMQDSGCMAPAFVNNFGFHAAVAEGSYPAALMNGHAAGNVGCIATPTHAMYPAVADHLPSTGRLSAHSCHTGAPAINAQATNWGCPGLPPCKIGKEPLVPTEAILGIPSYDTPTMQQLGFTPLVSPKVMQQQAQAVGQQRAATGLGTSNAMTCTPDQPSVSTPVSYLDPMNSLMADVSTVAAAQCTPGELELLAQMAMSGCSGPSQLSYAAGKGYNGTAQATRDQYGSLQACPLSQQSWSPIDKHALGLGCAGVAGWNLPASSAGGIEPQAAAMLLAGLSAAPGAACLGQLGTPTYLQQQQQAAVAGPTLGLQATLGREQDNLAGIVPGCW